MSPAARELGLIAAAKSRKAVLDKAQSMRAAFGLPPSPALVGVLVLTAADRVSTASRARARARG